MSEQFPEAGPREKPNSLEQNKNETKQSLDNVLKNVLGDLVTGKSPDWKKLLEDVMGFLVSGNIRDKVPTPEPAPDPSGKKYPAGSQEYLINTLLKGQVPVQNLNLAQRQIFARKIFGDGPGAKLLTAIDQKFGNKGEMILRMVALGKHEGGLLFGRTNKDPASGMNRGTFQIGGVASTTESTKSKYDAMLANGAKIYEKTFGEKLDTKDLNHADKDLIAHIGYIEGRSLAYEGSPEGLFQKLADPKLSDNELITLMHRKIQGGIPAIGQDVVAMTRKGTLKVNVDELKV